MPSSSDLPRPFGPYELVRLLAMGTYAEVFLARARSVAGFEKAVAIKMLHARHDEESEVARQLVEEANIASQLNHKNIVQVIDLGQLDGQHYIAMEYVDGIDLKKLLKRLAERNVPVQPRVAAYVLREICEGLEHAHRKTDADGKALRIVHRDVSPSNILISFSGEVKLTDFGLAKAALRSVNTQAGTIKGQFSYMAPEQVRMQSVDARTDVFSVGLVLYEMVTGKQAYPDAPLPVLTERLGRGLFEAPEKIRPDLPSTLIDVMKRAMAVEVSQRHPSARALAEDLTSFLYTQPPAPEKELARLLEIVSDSARANLAPLGARLVDDDSEEVTQIESSNQIKTKFLATTANRAVSYLQGRPGGTPALGVQKPSAASSPAVQPVGDAKPASVPPPSASPEPKAPARVSEPAKPLNVARVKRRGPGLSVPGSDLGVERASPDPDESIPTTESPAAPPTRAKTQKPQTADDHPTLQQDMTPELATAIAGMPSEPPAPVAMAAHEAAPAETEASSEQPTGESNAAYETPPPHAREDEDAFGEAPTTEAMAAQLPANWKELIAANPVVEPASHAAGHALATVPDAPQSEPAPSVPAPVPSDPDVSARRRALRTSAPPPESAPPEPPPATHTSAPPPSQPPPRPRPARRRHESEFAPRLKPSKAPFVIAILVGALVGVTFTALMVMLRST
jgi:serine/threonine protein kinase